MKYETCGVPIICFAVLKFNMYTFKREDTLEFKKAKDVSKNVVDDELKFEDYKNVLLNRWYMRHEINRIQSKNHNIVTCKINKVSLSCDDDKNICLNMDIVGYLIFTNLLINHKEMMSSKIDNIF